jgi:molybdenum cofactor cytidylyltransferase
LYFVADQPFFKEETLLSFLSGYERSGKGIGCVCCHGKLGNPSIFCAAYREALLALSGDKGGKQIIRAHTEDIWTMEVSDRELRDIDIREDLQEK